MNALPPNVVSGNAGQTKDVLSDRSAKGQEFAYRFIQNVGADTINFAIAIDSGQLEYHGQLGSLQQVAIPSMSRVSVYCLTAWSVATLEFTRTQG